jgi:hypothetical protein
LDQDGGVIKDTSVAIPPDEGMDSVLEVRAALAGDYKGMLRARHLIGHHEPAVAVGTDFGVRASLPEQTP